MADELVQTTGTEVTESQPLDVEAAVREEMERPEPSEGAKSTTEGEIKKGPVKLSANERVQQAVNEKKAAEEKAQAAISQQSQLAEEVSALRKEIETIKQMRETGQITGKQAESQAKTAEDIFKEAIDAVELSPDLAPYRGDIAKVAETIAKRLLEAELKPIRDQFKSEADRREQVQIEEHQKELTGYYSESAKAFPDLFESEPNEDGYPVLKPEYDQQAMEILKDYYYPVYNDKGEKIGDSNKLLESKKGLETLMTIINSQIEKVKIAKLENADLDRLKKSRVEGPESRRSSSEPKSVLDITREVMKEFPA